MGLPPAPVAQSRPAYLPQLDGLRALAILMVFVHHAYAVPLLWSGVDLFFILSGYLITNILLRDSARMTFGALLRHFYRRRAQRILPAYALALALIALFSTANWRQLWPFYAFFLQNLPYAFHWVGFGPLIPLWSLAVEQHFYLVWPFLVFFLPRRALVPTLLGILVAVPLLRALCTPLFAFPEAIYVLTPFRIDTMVAGALAALLLPRLHAQHTLRWAQLAMVLGLCAYALLARSPAFRRGENTVLFNTWGYTLNIVILGALFVWTALASERSWLYRVLSSRALRLLGRVSYTFYLLHLLVLTRVAAMVPAALVPLAGFAGTFALALLSWHLLEKPVLALGGHETAAARSPAA